MEQQHSQATHLSLVDSLDEEVIKRHAYLAGIFEHLPIYGSEAFWSAIETPSMKSALPLEVLVKCLRSAVSRGDVEGRNRIATIIIRHIQVSNEFWVRRVLNTLSLRVEEQQAFFNDLYADLCEHLMRMLIDPTRLFWEENFQHCLRFERKHVYHAFMVREGRWQHSPGKLPERIPRKHIDSLDTMVVHAGDETIEFEVDDEQARRALLAVEYAEIPHLVLHLPEKLRAVVWLIFWEGRTETDTARILGVSDRTVRKRRHEAMELLREALHTRREEWL
ncbi:MAG TPA: sigma-70 family RNA polymerase sigma factor [Ktedonobacteraceae bacterium]|nr:sigma-70 family RNA polymerase sigma factor [Ktedonobacteraceae bacterium]